MTPAQEAAIESRLGSTMRMLARRDPQAWRAMTPDARVLEAAKVAAADIGAEAKRKVENATRQVVKTAETETRIAAAGKKERTAGLVFDFERTHAYIDGVKRDNVRGLMDLIAAADTRDGASAGRKAMMVLFDAQNPQMTRDLALEVFARGKAGTGNAMAKKGAEAWLKVSDAMRERFNAAGGDVGRLDYGYLPQAHDQLRVLARGQDAWAAEVLPLLDRKQYLNEDGSAMTNDQLLDVLRGAWETISSDGANKTAPGAFKGSGARANRGSQSREIHFRDGEAYLQYLSKFGAGSMYDAMIGHIGGLARDIGLVERYGPNPEAAMRVQFDVAQRADGANARVFGNKADAYWRLLNGSAGTPESARVAMVGQHIRNVETFGKLQGAVLSSITDLGTYFVTIGFNRMSYWDAFRNIGGAMSKDTRDFMNAHGMIAESMISDLNRWAGENVAQSWSGRIASATMRLSLMNAWTDTLRRGFQMTHMQAIGSMRGNAWSALTEYDRWRLGQHGITEADWGVIQAAQPVVHNGRDFVTPDGIYNVPESVFAAEPGAPIAPVVFEAQRRSEATAARAAATQASTDLPNVLAAIDANQALSAAERKTAKAQERGRALGLEQRAQRLDADLQATIARYQADYFGLSAQHADRRAGEIVAKYIGMLSDESEVAVLNPDLATRAITTGGGSRAGTIDGELKRAVMQFKSFPIAMMSRHWRRMLDTPAGMDGAPTLANPYVYAGAMLVTLTALGAVAFQAKQVVSGKDPVDMTTSKFWTRALAQGGGAGFLGDILLGDTTDDRSPLDSLGRAVLGPSFGSAAELYELTKGNVDEYLAGKDTHAGAELIRFMRGHVPLTNIWYIKSAIDHAGLHALQESVSPGYLSRIQNKARKDWGTSYWWEPGTGLPERAPSFEELAGD